jgi:hypothetical protein
VKLQTDERGAAMVFGVFFAVFLLACVYALYGTIETVLFRQRLQDAADAAAFSAAVVNARGMNLLALINMTMAVVLSILVALRLAETLGYVAIGVCLALSAVTFGATAAAVPPLQTATKGIAIAAEKVQKPIEAILKVMHVLGTATKTVVPVGANVRVIDLVASHYGAAGVALPARLSLPVEDDDFSVLCEHAGRIAAELAILPISPLLPKRVEDKLGDVVGKIVAAGPSWFCGRGGKPPDLNSDEKFQWIELPRFASQDQCEEKAKTRVDTDEDDEATKQACNRANLEQLASVPDRLGHCRAGERVCPTDCTGDNVRDSCPPAAFGSCSRERADELASYAAAQGKADTVTCEPGSPYEQRLELAREQCLPAQQGGKAGLGGYTWLQRQVTREYRWDMATKSWREDAAARIEEPIEQKQVKDSAQSPPCGVAGSVGSDWQRDRHGPLCESIPRCQTSAYSLGVPDGPCARMPPPPSHPQFFSESSVEVVELLRCMYKTKNPQVTTPPIDLQKDLVGKASAQTSGTQGGQKQQANTNPFRLEADVMLGQSDFQLRSVVFSETLPSLGQRLVALAWWGGPRGDAVEDEGGVAARAMTRLGHLGVAQAEYYFDWTPLGKDAPNDQTRPADVTEWMWNMAWRARLRPFRVTHGDADPEPKNNTVAGGGKKGAGKGGKQKPALDCSKLPKSAASFCPDATSAVSLLGGGP